MPSPTETVMAFLAMLEQPGGFSEGVRLSLIHISEPTRPY